MTEPALELVITETPPLAVSVTEVPRLSVAVTETPEGPNLTLTPVPTTAIALQTEPAVEVVEVRVPGSGSDLYYEHVQSVAAAQWTVNHNLGKKPAITVIDSAGSVVLGEITHTNNNSAVLDFSAPFGGIALCS